MKKLENKAGIYVKHNVLRNIFLLKNNFLIDRF